MIVEWIAGLTGSLGVLFIGIMAKRHNTKMDKFEERLHAAINEEQTRQLISDKLDPLRSDYKSLHHRMGQIETKIDTIIDLQLRARK